MNNMTTGKLLEFIRGLALFLGFCAVIYALVRLKLGIPISVLQWLSQSSDPNQAVISFSGLVGSFLFGMLRLGAKLSFVKSLTFLEDFRPYAAGLPLWFIIIAFVVSISGLFVVFPSCQAPTSVQFVIDGEPDPFQPGDVYNAKAGSRLIVSAKPFLEDAILSCQWQASGNAFQMLSGNTGCQINVELNNAEGTGFITLQATQDFCKQSSIFTLQVKVKP